jgi:formamidopyrimidine-DNA glycosylase
MPELPEVEVLVRHLNPSVRGRTIHRVEILDRRALPRTCSATFAQQLSDARVQSVRRRGKYLVFTLRQGRRDLLLLAHLGMTGRLFLCRPKTPRPRHAKVVFDLGPRHLVFQDVRGFGRLSLKTAVLDRLGPEPLEPDFTADLLHQALRNSRQPIKTRLLDQSVLAGVGNIYASEALFLARIHPRTPSRQLDRVGVRRLRTSLRRALFEAVRFGSTVPLGFDGARSVNDLFYFGQTANDAGRYQERLRVYDREGEPCRRCHTPIQRLVLAGRSTYFCPKCQPSPTGPTTSSPERRGRSH